jgi:hypothetical protein
MGGGVRRPGIGGWDFTEKPSFQPRRKQSFGLSAWLAQLTARTRQNVAIVALANKLARRPGPC